MTEAIALRRRELNITDSPSDVLTVTKVPMNTF
jgi:hypothetical protein